MTGKANLALAEATVRAHRPRVRFGLFEFFLQRRRAMAEHAPPARKPAEPAAPAKAPATAAPGSYGDLLNRRSEAALAGVTQLLARRAAANPLTSPIRAPGPRPVGLAPSRTGLPDRLKVGVEAMSGLSMDDVRVHRNSAAPAQLQAHAYAKGTDIHLAPGQERHLPHEAWHVVQQKQGRVRETVRTNGIGINDHPALEAEADAMGALALRHTPIAQDVAFGDARMPGQAVTQRVLMTDDEFLLSLGFSQAEIDALGDGAVEQQLLDGIEYSGLKNEDVIDDKRHEEIKTAMADSTNMTDNQFDGLKQIVAFIVNKFPVENHSFIGIGRSPVLIIELLKQKYGASTHEMPIGGMTDLEPKSILDDDEESAALKRLIDQHVDPQAGQSYVIVDYAENGGSIKTFEAIFKALYPESEVQIMPVFLNDAEIMHGAQGPDFAELRNSNANVTAFVKRLRLAIGKSGLAGFEKFDISEGVVGHDPVVNAGGPPAREQLIADALADLDG